jgi:hypothetical protein
MRRRRGRQLRVQTVMQCLACWKAPQNQRRGRQRGWGRRVWSHLMRCLACLRRLHQNLQMMGRGLLADS